MTNLHSTGTSFQRPSPEMLRDQEPMVEMHPDTLNVLLRRYAESQTRPSRKDILPWFGMAFALLLPLLTADFKDVFGIKAGYWGGLALLGCVVSFLIGLRGLLDLFVHRKTKPMSPEELIQQVIVQRRSQVSGYIPLASQSRPDNNEP